MLKKSAHRRSSVLKWLFRSMLEKKTSRDIAKQRQSWYNSDPVPVGSLPWACISANKAPVTRLLGQTKEKKRWYLRRCF